MFAELTKKNQKTLARILAAGGMLLLVFLLFRTGVLPANRWLSVGLYLVPYLTAGYDVLWGAVRRIGHGQLLDETFLMGVATVGAFAIGEYPEAVFVMLFYQVGELFQKIAVGRSRKSISDLMNIRPDEARVMRNGEENVVSPEEVSVGEEILLRPGDRVPLDGIVLSGESEVNQSALTGEPIPRSVGAGDEVFSGSVNGRGLLTVRVTREAGESTASRILALVEESQLSKSKTENRITKFAYWYTPAVVLGAVLLALIPSIITGEWHKWIYPALIFLVVSCPCALVISVPLAYFGGLGRASRKGILIKGANYLEALTAVDTVAFDKTGTLTKGEFSVRKILPAEGETEENLLRLFFAAEQKSTHPIAVSLCEYARQKGADASRISLLSVEEIPGRGIVAETSGGRILAGNRALIEREKIALPPLSDDLFGSVIFLCAGREYKGCAIIADEIKPGAKEAVEALRRVGVKRVVMLSGDREENARRVAGALGLDDCRYELLPAEKVEAAEQYLSEAKGTFCFVGDGVNDAPVLARADVGIAMGALGSGAAIEAADVVLMDDDPGKIATAVTVARFTRRIADENIAFALAVKLGFLLLTAFGLVSMWAATFADVGVAVLAILNAMRTLKK